MMVMMINLTMMLISGMVSKKPLRVKDITRIISNYAQCNDFVFFPSPEVDMHLDDVYEAYDAVADEDIYHGDDDDVDGDICRDDADNPDDADEDIPHDDADADDADEDISHDDDVDEDISHDDADDGVGDCLSFPIASRGRK